MGFSLKRRVGGPNINLFSGLWVYPLSEILNVTQFLEQNPNTSNHASLWLRDNINCFDIYYKYSIIEGKLL